MNDKIKKIQELVSRLNIHRYNYYNLNKPVISDQLYDDMFDELSLLEKECNYILSNSPTQTVGYEVASKLNKVEHSIPLLSLDKTKSIDELKKFIGTYDSLLMLKADGLTVKLIYENGELIQASTRGNGHIGEEITFNAKTFKGLPLKINYKGKIEIAGEAVIHWNNFEEINSKLSDENKYATPRNLSAGSCRQLDSKICAGRNVCFYAFSLLKSDDIVFKTKSEQFQWLESQGFNVIPYSILTYDTMVLSDSIEDMNFLAEERFIPIDGMVISYNNIAYSESLGATNHHKLDGKAFKFADEMEETILRSVEWNTTRSGQINPTAIFDTVILDNTEVSRASLFNLTFIKEMQLNLLNSIKVSKRNMIIPYIEENLDKQKGNYIPIPDQCPSCGAKTEVKNTGTADFLYCTNDNCPAKLLDKFVHFCSRNAMNVEGFSESGVELFINQGFLKTFDDLYRLEQYKSKIIQLEGWGIKSYNKLIQAIEKSKNVKLENFLYALGIGQLGQGGSKRLVKHFNNNISMIANAKPHELMQVEDFGEVTANSVYVYFQENMDLVDRLLDIVNVIKPEDKKEISNTDSPFAGKKLYCTGTFSSYKKDELKAIVESLGAEFTSGYAKSLDYLVEGSLKSSSKVDKALKDGVEVLKEDEFFKMIGR